MGEDKSLINWHGKEQRYHMADMLEEFCDEVFISCRDDEQQDGVDKGYNTLRDTFIGLGPMGGILSALREQPDAAWLVVACDLPLVDRTVIQTLTDNRNTNAIATAFKSDYKDLPEPVITIYEPESYDILLQFLSEGITCPRKVLINSNVHLLTNPGNDALANANTPEEAERIRAIIKSNINV
ncbi:molybdenum cofactor guanylyltransferase [Mucilaginibacter conchicola]|uniref:Molybdenum cofactor guanylyltransferase n=2 Tax=Mucilaginibacter conchicola TaxID=2303333 RepID=A0A372P0W6_9SPHI|nr:molybdenum cofactor guanylyltransferase [Mucilaginibacter conchicola]